MGRAGGYRGGCMVRGGLTGGTKIPKSGSGQGEGSEQHSPGAVVSGWAFPAPGTVL